eukprot:gene1476-19388_t
MGKRFGIAALLWSLVAVQVASSEIPPPDDEQDRIVNPEEAAPVSLTYDDGTEVKSSTPAPNEGARWSAEPPPLLRRASTPLAQSKIRLKFDLNGKSFDMVLSLTPSLFSPGAKVSRGGLVLDVDSYEPPTYATPFGGGRGHSGVLTVGQGTLQGVVATSTGKLISIESDATSSNLNITAKFTARPDGAAQCGVADPHTSNSTGRRHREIHAHEHAAHGAKRRADFPRVRRSIDTWFGDGTCYENDHLLRAVPIGMVITRAWVSRMCGGSSATALARLTSIFARMNVVYTGQTNIQLQIGYVEESADGNEDYDNSKGEGTAKCKDTIDKQFDNFEDWVRNKAPQRLAAWHLLEDCYRPEKGGFTVGLAYVNQLCTNLGYNMGVSYDYKPTWMTIAHELGHTFGLGHSFEEGQGQTGGIMDYYNNEYDGYYQFNTGYRRGEWCANVGSAIFHPDKCAAGGDTDFTKDSLTPIISATCGDGIVSKDLGEQCDCGGGVLSCKFCSSCILQVNKECSPDSASPQLANCCEPDGTFTSHGTFCDAGAISESETAGNTQDQGFCTKGECFVPKGCLEANIPASWEASYNFEGMCDVVSDGCQASCDLQAYNVCYQVANAFVRNGWNIGHLPEGLPCYNAAGDGWSTCNNEGACNDVVCDSTAVANFALQNKECIGSSGLPSPGQCLPGYYNDGNGGCRLATACDGEKYYPESGTHGPKCPGGRTCTPLDGSNITAGYSCNWCFPNPCQNEGICSLGGQTCDVFDVCNRRDEFTCSCPDGFEGKTCAPSTCGNGEIDGNEDCECNDGSTNCAHCAGCKLDLGKQCSAESADLAQAQCCGADGHFEYKKACSAIVSDGQYGQQEHAGFCDGYDGSCVIAEGCLRSNVPADWYNNWAVGLGPCPFPDIALYDGSGCKSTCYSDDISTSIGGEVSGAGCVGLLDGTWTPSSLTNFVPNNFLKDDTHCIDVNLQWSVCSAGECAVSPCTESAKDQCIDANRQSCTPTSAVCGECIAGHSADGSGDCTRDETPAFPCEAWRRRSDASSLTFVVTAEEGDTIDADKDLAVAFKMADGTTLAPTRSTKVETAVTKLNAGANTLSSLINVVSAQCGADQFRGPIASQKMSTHQLGDGIEGVDSIGKCRDFCHMFARDGCLAFYFNAATSKCQLYTDYIGGDMRAVVGAADGSGFFYKETACAKASVCDVCQVGNDNLDASSLWKTPKTPLEELTLKFKGVNCMGSACNFQGTKYKLKTSVVLTADQVMTWSPFRTTVKSAQSTVHVGDTFTIPINPTKGTVGIVLKSAGNKKISTTQFNVACNKAAPLQKLNIGDMFGPFELVGFKVIGSSVSENECPCVNGLYRGSFTGQKPSPSSVKMGTVIEQVETQQACEHMCTSQGSTCNGFWYRRPAPGSTNGKCQLYRSFFGEMRDAYIGSSFFLRDPACGIEFECTCDICTAQADSSAPGALVLGKQTKDAGISSLTLEYVGQHCVGETCNLHTKSYKIKSWVDLSDAQIEAWTPFAVAGKGVPSNTVVSVGDRFEVSSYKHKISLTLNTIGGQKISKVDFKFNCDEPLNVGDIFGPFKIVDFQTSRGTGMAECDKSCSSIASHASQMNNAPADVGDAGQREAPCSVFDEFRGPVEQKPESRYKIGLTLFSIASVQQCMVLCKQEMPTCKAFWYRSAYLRCQLYTASTSSTLRDAAVGSTFYYYDDACALAREVENAGDRKLTQCDRAAAVLLLNAGGSAVVHEGAQWLEDSEYLATANGATRLKFDSSPSATESCRGTKYLDFKSAITHAELASTWRQSERNSMGLQYAIPLHPLAVLSANYTVTLTFMSPKTNAATLPFDVIIEENAVATDFKPFFDDKPGNPVTISFPRVSVVDGTLDIGLHRTVPPPGTLLSDTNGPYVSLVELYRGACEPAAECQASLVHAFPGDAVRAIDRVSAAPSLLDCFALGWDLANGSTAFCRRADVGGTCRKNTATFAEATEICRAGGARLCSIEELMVDPGDTPGCNLGTTRVWSRTPCRHAVKIGASSRLVSVGKPTSKSMQCKSDGRNGYASVQCCASSGMPPSSLEVLSPVNPPAMVESEQPARDGTGIKPFNENSADSDGFWVDNNNLLGSNDEIDSVKRGSVVGIALLGVGALVLVAFVTVMLLAPAQKNPSRPSMPPFGGSGDRAAQINASADQTLDWNNSCNSTAMSETTNVATVKSLANPTVLMPETEIGRASMVSYEHVGGGGIDAYGKRRVPKFPAGNKGRAVALALRQKAILSPLGTPMGKTEPDQVRPTEDTGSTPQTNAATREYFDSKIENSVGMFAPQGGATIYSRTGMPKKHNTPSGAHRRDVVPDTTQDGMYAVVKPKSQRFNAASILLKSQKKESLKMMNFGSPSPSLFNDFASDTPNQTPAKRPLSSLVVTPPSSSLRYSQTPGGVESEQSEVVPANGMLGVQFDSKAAERLGLVSPTQAYLHVEASASLLSPDIQEMNPIYDDVGSEVGHQPVELEWNAEDSSDQQQQIVAPIVVYEAAAPAAAVTPVVYEVATTAVIVAKDRREVAVTVATAPPVVYEVASVAGCESDEELPANPMDQSYTMDNINAEEIAVAQIEMLSASVSESPVTVTNDEPKPAKVKSPPTPPPLPPMSASSNVANSQSGMLPASVSESPVTVTNDKPKPAKVKSPPTPPPLPPMSASSNVANSQSGMLPASVSESPVTVTNDEPKPAKVKSPPTPPPLPPMSASSNVANSQSGMLPASVSETPAAAETKPAQLVTSSIPIAVQKPIGVLAGAVSTNSTVNQAVRKSGLVERMASKYDSFDRTVSLKLPAHLRSSTVKSNLIELAHLSDSLAEFEQLEAIVAEDDNDGKPAAEDRSRSRLTTL